MHRRELGAKGIRAQAGSLRDAVHLPRSCADRHPYELSGGRRQRAGLARALALRPKPVVADGPTSAPDVPVQAKVLGLFTELQREPGFAALFAGHDPAVVEQAADRVVVPHRGRIAEEGARARCWAARRTTARAGSSPRCPYPTRYGRHGAGTGTGRSRREWPVHDRRSPIDVRFLDGMPLTPVRADDVR